MAATEFGRLKMVQLLVAHGADIFAQNHYGNTALRMAYQSDVVKFLRAQETKKFGVRP
jgi:ankyrin repeat protein